MAFATALLACAEPAAAHAIATADDLSRLTLEELAQVEITSVSRQPEAVATAPSAVFVITADDIRRSAAVNLPEALRLAPNLEVAQIDAVSYAISARGFNSRETSNKLLVLIDGRAVYTTLYAGTPWDTHDVPLGDIERIEVISGPGGALYGANAVNGVINIITRSARDTRGARVGLVVGDDDRRATARFGGALGDGGAARVYVTAWERDNSFTSTGADLGDDAEGVQAGFRADWGSGSDRFTLQGDVYRREVPDRDAVGKADLSGHNLLARWTRDFGPGSSLMAQAYVDENERDDLGVDSTERTWDLHIQHQFTPHPRHAVVWGGGYRLVESQYVSPTGSPAFLLPPDRDIELANVFVHDRVGLTDDLELTLALKVEHSSFSGAEVLPSVRLGWKADDTAFYWARVARAVRTPSRIDRDLTFPGFLVGGTFESEELVAYEIGYRGRPTSTTAITVAAYYNDYDEIRTADLTPPGVFPVRLANTARGRTWGLEAWGAWDVTEQWRLSAGAWAIRKDFELEPGSLDVTGIASQGDDPDWQLFLRSRFDVTDRIELDAGLRAVDELATIPGYVEADARLGWRVNENLELSLNGYNLLHDRHFESDDAGRRRQIGRAVFLRLRWRS